MTKAESAALWRILTVLAGWEEIVAVQEIEDDLAYLLARMTPARDPIHQLDDTDLEQMLESLSAQIHLNLSDQLPFVTDVPGAERHGIT